MNIPKTLSKDGHIPFRTIPDTIMTILYVIGNILKLHANKNSLDFKGKRPILDGNRTRQGYARKRILKLAGHFFVGHA